MKMIYFEEKYGQKIFVTGRVCATFKSNVPPIFVF